MDTYGVKFDHPVSQLELELWCFREGRTPEQGGLGRYQHCVNAINIIWPKTIWNPWLERQIESLCENDWVSWTGCAASGKTFGSALFAMVWWLADPTNTTVILTSTTAKMIRKRSWANIQHLFRTTEGTFPGSLVDSKSTLQSQKGDDTSAIFAVAVLDGSTSKAVANIQGIHNSRVMAIVDEATDCPPAVFEVASNLSKGCREFKFLAIGNPQSKLDEHGRFSEPVDGWDTVGIDTLEWKTERGVCIRFDGMDSPNVRAGKTKWEFLITADQLRQAIEFEGESSPKFWKYSRGFWSPEGVVKTVLSETICHKYSVMAGSHVYHKNYEMIAGLDPAFGGDRCILKFAKYGDLENSVMALEFTETVTIKINASSSEPIHFQIARQVRDHCMARDVKPENLAIDATGEGGGLCDIIANEWSAMIQRIEFGGKPSDRPVSLQDQRPASEAYANRVTELWFSVREWVIRDAVRGLDKDTVVELCSRMFDDEKRKIVVEKKTDMKLRTGKSPDLGDAVALVVEMARRKGEGQIGIRTDRDKRWDDLVMNNDMIYQEDNLYVNTD